MKLLESFAQAVNPELTKTTHSKPTPKKESFEFIVSQVLPIMALNKEYGNVDTVVLIRPCYTNSNYVDTDNPLKTRRFYEAILTDTNSIEIENSRYANNYILIIQGLLSRKSWIHSNGLQTIYIPPLL